MAFYIESRYIDIRTLVDFSELEQTELFLSPTLADPVPPTEKEAPILVPVEEAPAIIEALESISEKISEKISEVENLSPNSTPEKAQPPSVELPPSVSEAVEILTAPLVESLQPVHAAAVQEAVDKTSLYAKYIIDKFGEEAGAELVKILLNPFIVNLVYRYEFSDAKNSAPAVNLRGVKRGSKNEAMVENDVENDRQRQTERRNFNDLLEQNRKRDLERKLQKEFELKFFSQDRKV